MQQSARRPRPESSEAEREKIARAGSLHWFHWLVVLASLLLTVVAWQFSSNQVEEKAEAQFKRESSQVVELVSERLLKYEDALWGGVGAIQAQGGGLGHEEWVRFADTLHVERKYPGINGIGVIMSVTRADLPAFLAAQRRTREDFQVHPGHDRDDLLPIVYIEPVETNGPAVGLDIAHEANRYSAAIRARESGRARMTGPIVLVQDAKRTPGFLFYAPYYAGPTPVSEDERRERFLGMVYAPFVVEKLMKGVLDRRSRHVGLRIRDGGEVLYDELRAGEEDFDARPMFQREVELELYGRRWTFDVWSSSSFRSVSEDEQPRTILLAGILIDALLLAMFLLISRANQRAIAYADLALEDLEGERTRLEEISQRLQATNQELEKFAYVASHDLQSPLRAITHLTTWIQEDLEEAGVLDEEVRSKISLLNARVARMSSLLDGLLQFSRIGKEAFALSPIHLGILEGVAELLDVPAEAEVEVSWEGPQVALARPPFELVVRNLVGNAIKHRGQGAVLVRVRARVLSEERALELVVEDNGPGIAPRFQERVFEVFQTLRPRDEVEGSGIGLALVLKSVQACGGSIGLESDPETRPGTTFRVRWPLGLEPAPSPELVPA
tara:strand:- start:486 stop:2327 length:1842 start_codon:yes stop_codon:yes gene_type:complete